MLLWLLAILCMIIIASRRAAAFLVVYGRRATFFHTGSARPGSWREIVARPPPGEARGVFFVTCFSAIALVFAF